MSDDSEFSNPVSPGPVFEKEFEKLRHMEAFSEAMFNRIIAFQEREHAAWDEGRPFADRIRGLPLHALMFSNPDRDPASYSHTVAPFYPLHSEIRQLAAIVGQVAEQPLVCDLHAGNGFIGSLLAREGVRVIGLRRPGSKPNQIENFHDPDCYEMRSGSPESVDFAFDVALSIWMPGGQNLTPAIVAHKPKLIIYVHTDHVDDSGHPQTGVPEAFRKLPDDYALIAEWSITRPRDLLHEVWPDLTPSIEEQRHVKVYAAGPWQGIDVAAAAGEAPGYDWEQELDMALTALRAKEALRAQGYPVD